MKNLGYNTNIVSDLVSVGKNVASFFPVVKNFIKPENIIHMEKSIEESKNTIKEGRNIFDESLNELIQILSREEYNLEDNMKHIFDENRNVKVKNIFDLLELQYGRHYFDTSKL